MALVESAEDRRPKAEGEITPPSASDLRLIKKSLGLYYSPPYIVDRLVERSLDKYFESHPSEVFSKQIIRLKLIDPNCGSGVFLIAAFNRLIGLYKERFGTPTYKRKRRIALDCIYGADIDSQAVLCAKLALFSAIIAGEPSLSLQEAKKRQAEFLSDANVNIRCFDALRADWETEFKDIFRRESPGFDIMIGNPPYGAVAADRRALQRKFQAGTTDSAALMTLSAIERTRSGGINCFIVPKPLVYSSNWELARQRVTEDLFELIDLGKAWKDVKLEQMAYILQKGERAKRYISFARVGKEFVRLSSIHKDDCRKFGRLLNGITEAELKIGKKIALAGEPFGNFMTNARGASLQSRINREGRGKRVIGGKQIKRCLIDGEKGYIDCEFQASATVEPGDILIQNIVAHITAPEDRIKITGAIADEETAGEIVLLDTVNRLSNISQLSSYYLLGLLHSKLINWYAYRFIFAKAIRTLHFDNPVTSRIPIRPIDFTNRTESARYRLIAEIVERITLLKKTAGESQSETEELNDEMEIAVCELYGLDKSETATIIMKT